MDGVKARDVQRLVQWARTEAAAKLKRSGRKVTERAIQREGVKLLKRAHG